MKEKLIRKMNREELLELLIQYSEEKEELELRITRLEKKLAETQKKLEERTIAIDQAGSIAEAALKLNGVFEAAQQAADQYLENIRQMNRAYTREGDAGLLEQVSDQPLSARRRKRGTNI